MFWLVSFSTLLFEMPLTRCVFTGLGEQVDAGDHERPSRSRRRTSRRSTSGTSSWLLILLVGSIGRLPGMKWSRSCKLFYTFDSLLKNIEVTCNFTCLMIFIVSQTKLIEWGWALKRKVTNTGYTERALMISQLHHYFQASQTLLLCPFRAMSILWGFVVP